MMNQTVLIPWIFYTQTLCCFHSYHYSKVLIFCMTLMFMTQWWCPQISTWRLWLRPCRIPVNNLNYFNDTRFGECLTFSTQKDWVCHLAWMIKGRYDVPVLCVSAVMVAFITHLMIQLYHVFKHYTVVKTPFQPSCRDSFQSKAFFTLESNLGVVWYNGCSIIPPGTKVLQHVTVTSL